MNKEKTQLGKCNVIAVECRLPFKIRYISFFSTNVQRSGIFIGTIGPEEVELSQIGNE